MSALVSCESCVLHCGLVRVEEALPVIIADAEEQRALGRLGIEVVDQAFAETGSDISLEREMEGLTGVRDNSVTAAAKASQRYELLETVVDSLHEGAAHMNDHTQTISRGPIDLRTAGQLRENLEIGCTGGPRRGVLIPLTSIVVPLWGGRGQEHCASGAQSAVPAFLHRMSTIYPGILDESGNSSKAPLS